MVAVSPVYETVPWGPVEQGAFLNAVLIADDPTLDPTAGCAVGQQLETPPNACAPSAGGRASSTSIWCSCSVDGTEIVVREHDLTLPHPLAHLRAFVLVPWLDIDPAAALTVAGMSTPVTRLLDDIEPVDKAGVTRSGPDPAIKRRDMGPTESVT